METDFFVNDRPINIGNTDTKKYTPIFQQEKSVKSNIRKEKRKPNTDLSESDEFSSPAILKSHPQFRTKRFVGS
jgi:hypothetical protein